jgi:hypothetical protein
MATTDLSSKSLGDILLQSGIGVPDHTAQKGSLYTDKNTAKLYQNIDGTTNWRSFSTVGYGEGFYQGNTTQTTISNTTNFFTAGINFTAGDSLGVTVSTDRLTINSGYEGLYEVTCCATVAYVGSASNFELGVGINTSEPANGSYSGDFVDVTYTRACVNVRFIAQLNASDYLRIGIRNLTSAANLIVRNAQLIIRKID